MQLPILSCSPKSRYYVFTLDGYSDTITLRKNIFWT